jgi:hypothetical protein
MSKKTPSIKSFFILKHPKYNKQMYHFSTSFGFMKAVICHIFGHVSQI